VSGDEEEIATEDTSNWRRRNVALQYCLPQFAFRTVVYGRLISEDRSVL